MKRDTGIPWTQTGNGDREEQWGNQRPSSDRPPPLSSVYPICYTHPGPKGCRHNLYPRAPVSNMDSSVIYWLMVLRVPCGFKPLSNMMAFSWIATQHAVSNRRQRTMKKNGLLFWKVVKTRIRDKRELFQNKSRGRTNWVTVKFYKRYWGSCLVYWLFRNRILIAQAGFEFSVWQRMVLNSWSSGLYFPSSN